MDAQRNAPERPDDRGQCQGGDREGHDAVDPRNEFEGAARARVEHEWRRAGAHDHGNADRGEERDEEQHPGDHLRPRSGDLSKDSTKLRVAVREQVRERTSRFDESAPHVARCVERIGHRRSVNRETGARAFATVGARFAVSAYLVRATSRTPNRKKPTRKQPTGYGSRNARTNRSASVGASGPCRSSEGRPVNSRDAVGAPTPSPDSLGSARTGMKLSGRRSGRASTAPRAPAPCFRFRYLAHAD